MSDAIELDETNAFWSNNSYESSSLRPATNLRWGENGKILFDDPNDTEHYWYVWFEKDGTEFDYYNEIHIDAENAHEAQTDVWQTFPALFRQHGPGAYRFQIEISTTGEDIQKSNGMLSDWSPVYNYRPQGTIPLPSNIEWIGDSKTSVQWSRVPGADSYNIILYKLRHHASGAPDDWQAIASGAIPDKLFSGQYAVYDFSNYINSSSNDEFAFSMWVSSATSDYKSMSPNDSSELLIRPKEQSALDMVWSYQNGKWYWYEHGVKQGTKADPNGVRWKNDPVTENRGREIYDPSSNGWYWLDSVYDGARADSKEVFMPYTYNGESTWSAAQKVENSKASDQGMQDYVLDLMNNRTGKWVRYDENGKMYKGWTTITSANCGDHPEQIGNRYYYDHKTGAMAKGWLTIDGVKHHFDEVTGVLLN